MARKITASSATKKLRDQLLRDLESEGQKILKQLSQQFTSDLQSQGSQIVQGLIGGNTGSGGVIGDGAGLFRLFGSALSFALNRPRTSVSSKESARSVQAEQFFRLSHRQALAEAGIELNKGDKNL